MKHSCVPMIDLQLNGIQTLEDLCYSQLKKEKSAVQASIFNLYINPFLTGLLLSGWNSALLLVWLCALFHFPDNNKRKALAIVHYITNTLRESLLQVNWKSMTSLQKFFFNFHNKSNMFFLHEICKTQSLGGHTSKMSGTLFFKEKF